MVDNTFRSYRARDAFAQGSARAPARGQSDDPLAELARLIGQSGPANDFGRDDRYDSAAPHDAPLDGQDWAVDEPYGEPDEPVQEGAHEQFEEPSGQRYDPPPLAESYPPPYRLPPASRDGDDETPAGRFPALRPRFVDDAAGHAVAQSRYRDEQALPEPHGRPPPPVLPRTRDDRYQYEDPAHDGSDDKSYAGQSYASEDYEDEAPNGRRRGGFFIVAAVLGVAVLGTAGAFTYRAMFGGSMLPSLPPIIRADGGPNKIIPSGGNSRASASGQADASNLDSGEKLVPRQENPVDVPAPVSAAPRVVSTIPIFPAPPSPPPGILASGNPGFPAPVTPIPGPSASAVSPANAAAASSAATMPQSVALPEPKKIHTVAIRPDQAGGFDVTSAAPSPPPPVRAPAARPIAPTAAASAPPRPAPVPALQPGGNAPLSIVPTQGGATPPSAPIRMRTALAQPTSLHPSAGTEAAAPAGSGYAVQVSSQRSEAEAQSSFRALQAKFPAQLGGHQPIVRRADLGAKGVYYRALVGPFASMDQAAGVCSSLKAAGGNCIVQRN